MLKIINCINKNYKNKLKIFLDRRKLGKTIDTSIVSKIISSTVATFVGAVKVSAIPFCFLEYKSKLALKFHHFVGLKLLLNSIPKAVVLSKLS